MICHAAKGNTSNESNVQAVRQCPVHRSPPATVWRRVRHSREWEHRRVLIWDSRHVVTDRPYPANPALTKTIGAAAPWNTSFNCHQRTPTYQHHQHFNWFMQCFTRDEIQVDFFLLFVGCCIINNTITDGGSTAPLYCWYQTEEKTIQEHKRDWKDVRGIVGRR